MQGAWATVPPTVFMVNTRPLQGVYLEGVKVMRKRYHSDNGAPCWRCSGTIYTYTVDDCVTYIGATCIGCGGDNMFYPQSMQPLDKPESVSAEHRAFGRHCFKLEPSDIARALQLTIDALSPPRNAEETEALSAATDALKQLEQRS